MSYIPLLPPRTLAVGWWTVEGFPDICISGMLTVVKDIEDAGFYIPLLEMERGAREQAGRQGSLVVS